MPAWWQQPASSRFSLARWALANGAALELVHRYIIPVERKYNITFDVDLYQAGVYLATYEHEIETTIDFAKNGNYVLSFKLAPETIDPENKLYPIEFKVNKVNGWDDSTINFPEEEEEEEEEEEVEENA